MHQSDLGIKKGFTIVETMLSMAFISMLIIGIAIVTNQVINSYRKGITLKSINQVGQALSDDLFRAATGARGAQIIANQDFISEPDHGALCLGDYSYLWTTGPALVDPAREQERLLYANTPTETNVPIRLAKVRDDSKYYCHALRQGASKVRGKIARKDVTELIEPGDGELAINQFQMISGPFSPQINQGLTTFIFSIGTFHDQQSIDANAQCLMTDNQSYNCAINKFEVVVRTNEG